MSRVWVVIEAGELTVGLIDVNPFEGVYGVFDSYEKAREAMEDAPEGYPSELFIWEEEGTVVE